MKSFFRRFSDLGGPGLFQFAEACFFLTLATAAVYFLPFRTYAPILGEQTNEKNFSIIPSPKYDLHLFMSAIRRGSRYLPFECKCLVQALAARGMLGLRKLPSTVHLGVAKDENGKLKAHAWVKVDEIFITGRGGVHEYIEITRFLSKPISGHYYSG